jgi:flagellar hook-associated protein 1 FlgK
MRSTFHGLETAKRSLFTQQAALSTTGHNIANANTKGYSRQVVNMVAARPIEAVGMMRSTAKGQLGTGVEFNSITRIREAFLDDQFRNENKFFGEWSTRLDTLEKLEAIFNEPSETGIRQVFESFWNAWQDLSKEPDSATARAVVIERALALTDAFNHTAKQLSDLSSDISDNITVKITQINSLTSQIAVLNDQIIRLESLGDNANDLRDQRDVLVDELSKMVNVTVTETETGYDINMGNVQLVAGREVVTTIDENNLMTFYGTGDLNSGEMYGLILSRDVYIPSYRDQLDTMAKALVEGEFEVTLPAGTVVPDGTVINGVTYSGSVAARTLAADTKITVKGINGLHRLGYTMEKPASVGSDFFVAADGSGEITAANIRLNPYIQENGNRIAASAKTYVGSDGNEYAVVGNNVIALAVAGLRNIRIQFDSLGTGNSSLAEGTFDEYWRAMVGRLGVQTQEASRQTDNQKILVDQVETRRQSISGVSLDEEMSNMIRFQHAYNAAARTMTVMDEVLDRVINGMGLVGR